MDSYRIEMLLADIDSLRQENADLKAELKDAEREIRGLYHELSDADERGY